MNITEELQKLLEKPVIKNEPMAKHTNFRIGGPAKWFVEVKSVDELKAVLTFAKDQGMKTFVFGGGSNMLVNDEGFDGIAIKIAMRSYEMKGTMVKAEAGVLSSALARATANAGLAGWVWAISLPGTIGGAVRGNAGCFGGETRDYLVSAEVLRDGEVMTLTNEELQFGYRESSVKHSNDIVLTATFEFKEGDITELKETLDDTLMKRKSSQPLGAGSAGCLFKNYEIQSDEELQRLSEKLDIPTEMSTSRRLSAGWLIDNLDLKGMTIGDAQISQEHGNFVVNLGNATAEQIVQLIAVIKTKARNEYGINLQEEVQLVGF